MSVNVRGVLLALKESLAAMKPRRSGSIVILSSIAGMGASAMLAPYGASKHAVLGLMRAAAREAAASGVRVNAVCPGPVESEMMQRIDASFRGQYPGWRDGQPSASAALPMGRYALPEEVGRMVLFLCSEASSYCNGGAYAVDGGFMAR
jgi:NAD(P)-dependent dehydrogenase (short-subunit alcohol dehydrogenase family)